MFQSVTKRYTREDYFDTIFIFHSSSCLILHLSRHLAQTSSNIGEQKSLAAVGFEPTPPKGLVP